MASLSLYQFINFKKQAYVTDYISIAQSGIKQKDYDDLMDSEQIKNQKRKNNRGQVDRMQEAIKALAKEGIGQPTMPQIFQKMNDLKF